MTRIKKIFIPLFGLLFVFFAVALSGCKKEYNCYVEGSYSYSIQNRQAPLTDIVTSSFIVITPDYGDYILTYVIETEITNTYTGKKRTETSEHSRIVRSYEGTVEERKHTVTSTSTFSKISVSDSVVSARLISVKIKPDNGSSDSSDSNSKVKDYAYAIGFGTAGGVVLIGLIVVFVLDKTGVLYKKRK